jgi:hypothetical protein
MILPGVYTRINDVLQPVASARLGAPIALLISFVVAFYMYSLRDVLHQYTLTQPFKEKPGPSLIRVALMFFVAAVVLGFVLGFALTTKDSLVSAQGDAGAGSDGIFVQGTTAYLLFKLAMTGCLIFVLVFLALSAGIMAAYEYGGYVAARRPDPIFLKEELLLRVVLGAVREHLEIDDVGSTVDNARESSVAQRGTGPDERLSISQMKRRGNAGLALTLQNEGDLAERGDLVVREDRTWYVEADRWGQLTSVEEKGFRLAQLVEESLPPVDAVRLQVRKLVGSQADLKLIELERREGGTSLRFVQEGPSRLAEGGRPAVQAEWMIQVNAEGQISRIRKRTGTEGENQEIEREREEPQVEGARAERPPEAPPAEGQRGEQETEVEQEAPQAERPPEAPQAEGAQEAPQAEGAQEAPQAEGAQEEPPAEGAREERPPEAPPAEGQRGEQETEGAQEAPQAEGEREEQEAEGEREAPQAEGEREEQEAEGEREEQEIEPQDQGL